MFFLWRFLLPSIINYVSIISVGQATKGINIKSCHHCLIIKTYKSSFCLMLVCLSLKISFMYDCIQIFYILIKAHKFIFISKIFLMPRFRYFVNSFIYIFIRIPFLQAQIPGALVLPNPATQIVHHSVIQTLQTPVVLNQIVLRSSLISILNPLIS